MKTQSLIFRISLILLVSFLALSAASRRVGTISGPQNERPTNSPSPRPSGPSRAAAAESAYWNSIKDSTNPKEFEKFLRKYPRGRFAKQAGNRKRALEEAADATRRKEAKPGEQKQPPAVISDRKLPPEGTSASNWLGMQVVYLFPKSFIMGSNNGSSEEKPGHQVTIKEGFYMGRHEMRMGLWFTVMGSNPDNFNGIYGEDLPVVQVSWIAVQSFLRNLNQKAKELGDKFEYRLPTEAEWEYACRAGTTGDYAGDLGEIAWYAHNSGDQTHSIGKKQPNDFGLYDMHGNVWEWCQDVWHDSYVGAPVDGSAWMSGGNQSLRVVRGGSYHDPASSLRSAYRWEFPRDQSDQRIGFRVVAVPRRP